MLLQELPEDILESIFAVCEPAVVARIAQCCKLFETISMQPGIWNAIAQRRHYELDSDLHPKEAFKHYSDLQWDPQSEEITKPNMYQGIFAISNNGLTLTKTSETTWIQCYVATPPIHDGIHDYHFRVRHIPPSSGQPAADLDIGVAVEDFSWVCDWLRSHGAARVSNQFKHCTNTTAADSEQDDSIVSMRVDANKGRCVFAIDGHEPANKARTVHSVASAQRPLYVAVAIREVGAAVTIVPRSVAARVGNLSVLESWAEKDVEAAVQEGGDCFEQDDEYVRRSSDSDN